MQETLDLTCDERASDSPFVETIWRGHSGQGGAFLSMAQSQWGMVITTYRGQMTLTIRGPETQATRADCPPDAEFIGIQFKHGTLIPQFPARALMDRRDINLPSAAGRSFWLNGAAWQFPDYENAETFVNWLARDGLLRHDPLVSAALLGHPVETSLRTLQRRFLQATGITQTTLYQIERARYATRLLKQGVSILDTVERAGYFDQPHLTRALKHLIGQTPAQITDQQRTTRLSFLYKTTPLLLTYDKRIEFTAEGQPA